MIQFDPRRIQSGHGFIDLAVRDRAGILDPAIAGQQLFGFADGNFRQPDIQPFLVRLKLQQDVPGSDLVTG